MSADTDDQWTLGTLYVHFRTLIETNDIRYSQRFEASQSAINTALIAQQTAMGTALTAQKLAVDTAQAAADRAVTKAEIAADKRFDSLNELRSMATDQQRTFMSRVEAELRIKTLEDKIESMQITLTTVLGQKSGANSLWGYIIAAVGILIALSRFIPLK
jgi:hypothetical protein